MIPRAVTVGGVRYAVERPASERIAGNRGENDPEQTRIYVARELSTEAARSTYLHEVGHVALYESGMLDLLRDLVPKRRASTLEEALMNVWLPVYRAAIGVK